MLSHWSPGSIICLVLVVGWATAGVIRAIRGTKPYEKPDNDDDVS